MKGTNVFSYRFRKKFTEIIQNSINKHKCNAMSDDFEEIRAVWLSWKLLATLIRGKMRNLIFFSIIFIIFNNVVITLGITGIYVLSVIIIQFCAYVYVPSIIQHPNAVSQKPFGRNQLVLVAPLFIIAGTYICMYGMV